jgi:hypothetical protein
LNKGKLPNANDLKLALELRNGRLPTKMQEKLDNATKKFDAAKPQNQGKKQKHEDLDVSDSSDTPKQRQSNKFKATTSAKNQK